jgi:hypothetical protein
MTGAYTYMHCRPGQSAPFYIGKGVGRRAWHKGGRNKHWHNVVAKNGFDVHILARWPSEREAIDHEVFLIDTFRSAGIELCNVTSGGEGASGMRHTDEAKAKVSAANKGRSQSTEWREALANRMRGRIVTESERDKKRARMTGIEKTPELIESYLPALRAAMAKPEVRAKIAAAARKRTHSAETRAKMAASARGRKHSAETRAKMSDSAAAARQKRKQQQEKSK